MTVTPLAPILAAALVAASAMLAFPAQAQTAPGPATLQRVTKACRAETVRFCPALAETTPRPRDQVICLKPFKSSLSFNCRSAVNALTPR